MTAQERSPRRHTRTADLSAIGERGWLRRVRAWFARDNARLAIPMGDDAAALAWGRHDGPVVVSTDALIEGVHFRREWTTMRDLGAKALAVNLSDLAAMGAAPVAAFLALSVPPETDAKELHDFFMGLRAAGRRWACPLAGGDLTRAPQWTIAMTVLGRSAAAGRLARRDAARPGQTLYVTGQPGESGAGLAALTSGMESKEARTLLRRHHCPTPRLREAAVLARACRDLAMIDVSDGIWNDAGQMAEASGARIELMAEALPISLAMERLADKLHRNPLEWTLCGGEDYELLFATALSEARLRAAWTRALLRTPLRRLGRVVAGRGVWIVNEQGKAWKIPDGTFRHF